MLVEPSDDVLVTVVVSVAVTVVDVVVHIKGASKYGGRNASHAGQNM